MDYFICLEVFSFLYLPGIRQAKYYYYQYQINLIKVINQQQKLSVSFPIFSPLFPSQHFLSHFHPKTPQSNPAWKFAFNLWSLCNWIYMNPYHQRSKIEAVNSAIKKRYGDSFKCRRKAMRFKEVALRFIAYNIFIMLCYNYSVKQNLPLYVRA